MATMYSAVIDDVHVYETEDKEEFDRNIIMYGDNVTIRTMEIPETKMVDLPLNNND